MFTIAKSKGTASRREMPTVGPAQLVRGVRNVTSPSIGLPWRHPGLASARAPFRAVPRSDLPKAAAAGAAIRRLPFWSGRRLLGRQLRQGPGARDHGPPCPAQEEAVRTQEPSHVECSEGRYGDARGRPRGGRRLAGRAHGPSRGERVASGTNHTPARPSCLGKPPCARAASTRPRSSRMASTRRSPSTQVPSRSFPRGAGRSKGSGRGRSPDERDGPMRGRRAPTGLAPMSAERPASFHVGWQAWRACSRRESASRAHRPTYARIRGLTRRYHHAPRDGRAPRAPPRPDVAETP